MVCVLFGCRNNKIDANETKEKSKKMVYWEKALEHEFKMLRNPATGKIPEGIYEAELMQAKSVLQKQIQEGRVSANTYAFQGPENLGGRVRSVVYDKRYNGTSNKIIIAGGVSGGVFKSIDDGATWTRKSPLTVHYSCTSIAQDTRAGLKILGTMLQEKQQEIQLVFLVQRIVVMVFLNQPIMAKLGLD